MVIFISDTMHSIDSQDDRHTPRAYMRKFIEKFGGPPNWNPQQIAKKFTYKNNRYWHAKQKTLKSVSDFANQFSKLGEKNRTFLNALQNGSNFICLVSTENLTAKDQTNEERLAEFEKDYIHPVIWTIGSAKLKRVGEISTKNFSTEVIQIDDLRFESDRTKRLQVLCPLNDIMMIIAFEKDPNVGILYHNLYFEHFQSTLKIKTSYKSFFVDERSVNTSKPTSQPMEQPMSPTMTQPMSPSMTQQDINQDATAGYHNLQNAAYDNLNDQAEISPPNNSNIQTETDEEDRKVYISGNFVVVEWNERKKEKIPIVSFKVDPYKSAWRNKDWIPNGKETRKARYDELFYDKTTLFDLLKRARPNNYYCIPFQELISQKQKKELKIKWDNLVGCKMPNENIYIVFDENKAKDDTQTAFTGTKNILNPNNSINLRSGLLCHE